MEVRRIARGEDAHYADVVALYRQPNMMFGLSVGDALSHGVQRVRSGRALEIGYGEGAAGVIFLAKLGFEVKGIDISDIAPQAKANVEAAGIAVKGSVNEDAKVELVTGNIMTADIGSGFSIVNMRYVLQAIKESDKEPLLRKMAELTAPGGIITLEYFTAFGIAGDGVTPNRMKGVESRMRTFFEKELGWTVVEQSAERDGKSFSGEQTKNAYIIVQKPRTEEKAIRRE